MINGMVAKGSGLYEDVWSTSTLEPEISGLQSQRSLSSIGASPMPSDLLGDDIPDFINHGK